MKRSVILQPLSREHHTALSLAKACQRAALSTDKTLIGKACQRAIHSFLNELEPHFQIEESSLLPQLFGTNGQPLAHRTLAEHRLLRELCNGLQRNDAGVLAEFGQCLSAHVRFEERMLFPAIEAILD